MHLSSGTKTVCGRVLVSTRVVLVWALYSTQHPARIQRPQIGRALQTEMGTLLNYNQKNADHNHRKKLWQTCLISHWRASLCRCAEEKKRTKKTHHAQTKDMRVEEVVQHPITNQPTPQKTLGGFTKILEENRSNNGSLKRFSDAHKITPNKLNATLGRKWLA